MPTLREALVTLLTADATLSALLTGGVFNAEDFSFDGGGANEVPYAVNGVHILPFAIVRFGDSDQFGYRPVRGRIQSVEVYVYDNVGYATIDSAIGRVDALLDQVRVTADDRQLASFEYAHESREMDAPEIAGASCRFIRFMNTFIR